MGDCVTPDLARERFLLAVEKGDVNAVKNSLERSLEDNLDIDCTDASGRSALHIAIENGNLGVMYPLLENNIQIRDAVLRAVEHDFGEAVRILCDRADKLKDPAERQRIIDSHCTNDDFHPDITPIILAAQRNNFQMVKILLENGASIPCVRAEAFQTAAKDSFQRSVGTMEIYKGLASEAYVAVASRDPVHRAFTLCDELRRLAEIEIEFKVTYNELEKNMEKCATDFISQARSSEEIMTVLTHPDEDTAVTGKNPSHSPLPKISRALDLGLQQFIAHPNCQQVIITQFYKRLMFVRDKSALYRFMLFATLLVLYPLLAVLHVYSTNKRIKTFVRFPVIMFVMYLASDLTFVTLLTWEAVSDRGEAHKLSFTRPYNIVALVWIIGMLWQEIEYVADRGIRKVVTQWEHIRNTLIIIMFLLGFFFEVYAYFGMSSAMTNGFYPTDTPVRARRSVDDLSSAVEYNLTQGKFTDIGDYVLGELVQSNPGVINETSKQHIKWVVWHVMNYTARRRTGGKGSFREDEVDRSPTAPIEIIKNEFLNRTWNHPQVMARSIMALATAFTVLRMLPYVVISDLIGPLQISLVSMIIRTFHFFFVVATVLGSFAVGLTLTYSYYNYAAYTRCLTTAEVEDSCKKGSFANIFQSIITLYWSIFGLMPMSDLHLHESEVVMETAGSLLYAAFYVLLIIVLLNALIAVWSNVYNEIEENADMQWKFSCTGMWMAYLQKDLRVPPPFNLLPTRSGIQRLFSMFSKRGRWAEIAVEEMNTVYDEKWLRTEGIRLFIDGSKRMTKKLEEQANYSRVISRLLDRYVLEKTAGACSTTGDITKVDLRNLKNDLISLRYDTFLKLCDVHDDLVVTSNDCLHVRRQSTFVPAISEKAEAISDNLIHNLVHTLDFQTSLAHTVSKLPPPPPTPTPPATPVRSRSPSPRRTLSPLPARTRSPSPARSLSPSSLSLRLPESRPVTPERESRTRDLRSHRTPVRQIVVKLVKQFERGQIGLGMSVGNTSRQPWHTTDSNRENY